MSNLVATYKDSDGTHFNCSGCDKKHTFSGYVAAHWRERLIHTCDCGAKHQIQQGRVFKVKGRTK